MALKFSVASCRKLGKIFLYTYSTWNNGVQGGLRAQLEKAVSSGNVESHGFVQQLRRTLKGGRMQLRKENDGLGVTTEIIVKEMSSLYSTMHSAQNKLNFFTFIGRYLGPDHKEIISNSQQMVDLHTQDRDISRVQGLLRASLRPAYLELFSMLPRMEGGLRTLISIRGDLLSLIKAALDSGNNGDDTHHLLQEMDIHLREVISQWFSLGFLDLQRITWESPCDIIEKISEYEAVHSVKHWRDIKHRVGPYRRVFVFTHRSMPREPIIILHTALTPAPSDSVQTLLKLDSEESEDTSRIHTAVFYSISAAHRGLSGIDLGNSLILQVVQELKKEFPSLDDFVTLSPIPGFRKWLESHLRQNIPKITDSCKILPRELRELVSLQGEGNTGPLELLQKVLINNEWVADRDRPICQALKRPLLSLCARYLITERRRGFSYNPVTHFHVRNGASVWRLNWLADVSPHGMNQSYGLMTNYRYNLADMARNNLDYLTNGKIRCSDLVSGYL